jgi:hypothetical protein
MDTDICKPALIYLIIALIMLCVGVLLKLDTISLFAACSQLMSIILCTLLLIGLCSIVPELSWVITVIFIICTISTVISMILNWLAPPLV